ncbi:transducin beta-like protein 3 [Harmonia axyridis]|uniref:transducin beta-like protein 3 n=1 Tax=Harmonia axyridis TaxID=115357 RepID=UPI001E278373|nr:transducin beta-like protein 3 [Harmonia axyridis]
MGSSSQLKEVFEVESKHTAFYTGGNVEWHEDVFYCQSASSINLFNILEGTVSKTVGEEYSEDADFIQSFTSDGKIIVSAHKSGLLKLWNESGEVEKTWKSIHKGPIARLQLNGNRLASGGSDSGVRIWNIEYNSCVLSLKGCQGVVSVLQFVPNEEEILATGDDGKILHFDLVEGKLMKKYEKHYSKVTSIVFTHDNTHFISCGRDKVMILWKFKDDIPLKSIPFYEAVDSIVSLPAKFKVPGFKSNPEYYYIASAGEKGVIRIWDVLNVKEIYVQENSLVSPVEGGALAVSNLLFNSNTKTIAVVTVEHNIILHHLKSFACTKQFVGFTDEIFDIAFMGQNDSHLAIATNSCDIKLYDNTSMNCQLVKGHTDIVLSLSVPKTNPNLLLSSSKDKTIRLWLYSIGVHCIGVGKRHTATVGSCCFSQTSAKWAVSVSSDFCLKLWDIPSVVNDKLVSLNCPKTGIAHQNEINCVAIAPNDKIIGTASQDKTAKLWDENLNLIGVLRGHRRGVLCLRFAPIDKIVLTSSTDGSIRLWNLETMSCCSHIPVHDSSVFKVDFISNGNQILSCGGDGCIKVVNVKDQEIRLCLAEHNAKIWAIAVNKEESMIVTGDADSTLIKWKDMTIQKRMEKFQEAEMQVAEQQKLDNYLQSRKWKKAIKLAIRLNKPFKALQIIKEIVKTDKNDLKMVVESLTTDHKSSLFNYALNWTKNKRHSGSAQIIFEIFKDEILEGKFKPQNFSSKLEELEAFTRPFIQMSKNKMKMCNFFQNSLQCMKSMEIKE